MRPLLDFDDAGAGDDHPAKDVKVGHIREWHDEMERLRMDLRMAINSDSELCRAVEADNRRLRDLLHSAPGVEVSLMVPERDYSSMTPLACYEAGMLDAAHQVRAAIRAAITAGKSDG